MNLSVASLLRAALLALIAAIFVYPLARLLSLPLWSTQSDPGGWLSLINSMRFALITALITAPLGAFLAHEIARRRGLAVRLAAIGLWLLFLAPSYVLTTGWIIFLALPGLRQSILGTTFLGPGGMIFLFILKALPFAVFVSRATFAAIGAEQEEAALVLGLPARTRLMLTLRLSFPALAAGFAMAGIETMQEFGIPATLGVTAHIPILTYAIYQRLAQVPTDFSGAAMLCWRLIFAAGLFAGFHLIIQRRHKSMLVHGRNRQSGQRMQSPPTRAATIVIAGLIWSLAIIIPLAALIMRATAAVNNTTDIIGPVTRSMGFAALAATLAIIVALALLKLRAKKGLAFGIAVDAAMVANMAVPGLILAAGYILAFNNNILPLYGTSLLLIIAYAAGTIPIALRLLQNALGQIDGKLGEAARLHGLRPLARAIDIEAALLATPLAYAWLLSAAAIMFELPISELLYPPGQTPLAVAIVGLDQIADFAAAARLSLVGMASMACLTFCVMLALRYASAPSRPVPA